MLGGADEQVKFLRCNDFYEEGAGTRRAAFAKSRGSNDHDAMRRQTEILLSLIGVIAVPSSVLMFHFSGMPLQPAHPATARVFAIKAWDARFRAGRDYIVVRNAHGTGQFSMPDADVRCQVGDQVPVQQQGVTLTRVARTCR